MQELNLLWLEDNFSKDFEDVVNILTKHCHGHHRHLEIHSLSYYPADFQVKLFEGVFSVAFIDLNLEKGQKGIDIIKQIRDNGAFIDILLYSNNPGQLIELTEGRNYVEGIFRHATYKGLEEKMKNVIDQVLYKEMMAIKRSDEFKHQTGL
ncbi:hypothetical protein [Olivibacter jilunii]|uniref:hypothetical protein n=1 Tax=Olivibacter jilunii TaxID=985016 RepID=UPI003F190C00